MDDWFITKDKQGRRIYGPDENRNNIRSHYKELYELREVPFHPYHETVESTIKRLKEGTPETDPDLWPAPTRADIAKIISKKKNRKATTDWKNEIIKRGGDPMVDLILPVIEAFWNEEKRPDHWGSSIITNIWKGKGDREVMSNQRGIAYSGSIETIAEEAVCNILTNRVEFS